MDGHLPPPPRGRRARPVADAPVDALLGRLEDVTKGWLLALLEQAPLEEAPAILAADLARDGPRVCDAIVRALADDTDLRRIEPGGALELLISQTGEFAGATTVDATARAVDTLGEVVWSAVRSELRYPVPDQVSELAERLALVMALVRGAALRRCAEAVRPSAPPAAEAVGAPTAPPVAEATARPAEEPAPESVRDARRPPSDALWVGALQDEIARSGRSGTPLSLLLVELEDADRIASVEPEDEVAATFGRFAQAVRRAMRRQDLLACESDSRAWIIARDTGRPGAQALGARVVESVREAKPWRGAPMAVNVGVAVLGEDGADHSSLMEAAEESRFAAEASGIAVVRAAPQDEPRGPGPRLVS